MRCGSWRSRRCSPDGPQGIRQVNVRGVVGAAFTHRDSRAGDPDLHTHVAVANKVQSLDGRWLSIDGRVLFKAKVAASETYNTALEHHLRDRLGVRFTERPGTDPAKRPIREIIGVDLRLNERWSSRRALINTRQGELAVKFQADHGRPPTAVEALHLAQQATLETRDTKHEPRSYAEQRATWLAEAAAVLGGRDAVTAMVAAALAPAADAIHVVDARWVGQTADRIVAVLEQSRSTWQLWHVRAEAQRQARTIDLPVDQSNRLVDLLVSEVLEHRSVALKAPPDGIEEPDALRRADGWSVYTIAGADRYTSQRILDAEQRILTAARRHDGAAVDSSAVELVLEMAANGTALDAGQAALVRQMCASGARLELAIAPAGAGKTTALTWGIRHNDLPDWATKIDRRTLMIIDEAGMADTVSLDIAIQYAIDRGASVRLIGDDQQLAAIGTGGILRDIKHTHGALHLGEVHRFTDPTEARASLA